MFSHFFKTTILRVANYSTSRHVSSLVTSNSPQKLTIITWPAGIRKYDNRQNFIGHTPLSPIEAKRKAQAVHQGTRLLSPNETLELFGHAAAEFTIDLVHPELDSNLKDFILSFAQRNGINPANLQSLSSYVSWFPNSDDAGAYLKTGVKIDFHAKLSKLLNIEEKKLIFPNDLPYYNEAFSNFYGTEIKAVNSNKEQDASHYGNPLQDRVITLTNEKVDYLNLFLTLCNMMQPRCSEDKKVLLLDQTLQNSTYFGLDIIRTFANFLRKEDNISERELLMECMDPNHVCTTAVLRLIRAAIGMDACQKLAKQVVEEHPKELTLRGLPLVDFTHYFTKAVEQYLLTSIPRYTPKVS